MGPGPGPGTTTAAPSSLFESGKVRRRPLISHALDLDDAPEGFAIQDQPGAAIKVVLKP